jgi:hypothetical protein
MKILISWLAPLLSTLLISEPALAAVIVQGPTGAQVSVDSTSNAAHVSLYDASGNLVTGFFTKDPNGNVALVTPPGRQRIGQDTIVLWDPVDGTALNTNIWASSTSTMTITQTIATGILLNAGASVATSVDAILNSIKIPARIGDFGMAVRFYAKPLNMPEANAVGELGFGSVAGTSAPTDGSFFRWTGAAFQAVVNFNGTETTATLTTPTSAYHHFEIWRVYNSTSIFFVDGTAVATLLAGTNPSQSTSTRLPVFMRVYDTGSAPAAAAQLSIGAVTANQLDLDSNKTWGEQLTQFGRGSYQSPITAFLQTANHTNSTSPSSATLSNTAAGYTTLGGRWQFAAIAGAVTDYALFAFQVPAGYQLVVKQVNISSCNTGAADATTATVMDWFLGVNSSAVSLATTDSPPASWAPRRIPIGTQGYIVGAAIGSCAMNVVQIFDPPIVVDSQRFLHVGLQIPIGTATASEVFRGDVMIDGYFE